MNTQLLEINLSSHYERKKTQQALRGNKPLYISLIIAISVILAGGLFLYVSFQQKKLTKQKNQYAQLKGTREEAEKLIAINKKLTEQKGFLDKYLRNKVAWAERWKQVSLIIPEEVFLTEIDVTNPDPIGEKTRVQLKGRAFGDAGESVVLQFLDTIKKTACFSNAFSSIKLYSIATEKDEKIFTIEMSK